MLYNKVWLTNEPRIKFSKAINRQIHIEKNILTLFINQNFFEHCSVSMHTLIQLTPQTKYRISVHRMLRVLLLILLLCHNSRCPEYISHPLISRLENYSNWLDEFMTRWENILMKWEYFPIHIIYSMKVRKNPN